MNFAIIIGLFVIVGLKILHGTDANNDTSSVRTTTELRLPQNLRMRLYRRKIIARRRRGYFRDTTEKQFQSYESWGAGGQLDLLLDEYGQGPDREEEELPQEPQDYWQALRARWRPPGYNLPGREYEKKKMLMKSRQAAKKAKKKDEDFFDPYSYMGHWVYERNVSIRPSEALGLSTTNRTPAYGYYTDRSCLRPCPLIYKFDYGVICAIRWHRPDPNTRRKNYKDHTHFTRLKLGTSLYPTYFLRNFTNICEMEVHNCIMLHMDATHVYSWKVMLRGPCPNGMDDENEILATRGPPGNPLPLTDGKKEVELAEQWIKEIEENRDAFAKARQISEAKNKTNPE